MSNISFSECVNVYNIDRNKNNFLAVINDTFVIVATKIEDFTTINTTRYSVYSNSENKLTEFKGVVR